MKKIIIVKIMTLLVVVLGIYATPTMAASLTISTSKSNAESGDTITVTVNGNGVTGKVALSASGGTLSESSIWVDNSKSTASVKINGNNDVKIVATPVDVSDSNTGEPLSLSATSATVKVEQKNTETKKEEKNNTTVKEQENKEETNNNQPTNSEPANDKSANSDTKPTVATTDNVTVSKKSNNANLSDLGIRPNDFSGFVSGTTSYNVTVPNDVEKVEIYAVAQDKANAKVTGGGNKKLTVGNNTFNVVVTAEDGKTKKTYTLNIKREEGEDVQDDNSTNKANENTTTETVNETTTEINQTLETTTKEVDLTKLDISGYTITPSFSPNIYEYNLNVPEDVSNLDIKAESSNSNVQVEVAGNKDLKEGENVVTVICYNKETEKTSTYQIIVNKQTTEKPHAEAINEAKKKRSLIIKVGIAIIIVLIILCIIVFKKGNEEEDEIEAFTPKENKKKEKEQTKSVEEDQSNEMFRELSEERKKRKDNIDLAENEKKQIKAEASNQRDIRPKRQKYLEENDITTRRKSSLEENSVRPRRQKPLSRDEIIAKREARTLNEEDAIQKDPKREKMAQVNRTNSIKSQKERDEEFDKKLLRIRRERRSQKKGGKHF